MPRRIPVAVALGLVSILAMSCTAPPPGPAVTSKGGAPAPLGECKLQWREPTDSGDVVAPFSLTSSEGIGLELLSLRSRAVVADPLAFTELHMVFQNPQDRQIEGRFEINLPPGAAISRFAMKIGGDWQEAEVVELQAARRAYEDALHRRQDPALLEKNAGNRFSARVFPIPARAVKEIIVSYSEALPSNSEPYRLLLRGLPKLKDLEAASTLIVGVRIDETGKISAAIAPEPPLRALGAAVQAQAPRWLFKPAKKDGQPVRCWGTYGVEVEVELEDAAWTAFSLVAIGKDDPLPSLPQQFPGDTWISRYPAVPVPPEPALAPSASAAAARAWRARPAAVRRSSAESTPRGARVGPDTTMTDHVAELIHPRPDVVAGAVPALGPRIRDPDATTRAVVARTLGRIGGGHVRGAHLARHLDVERPESALGRHGDDRRGRVGGGGDGLQGEASRRGGIPRRHVAQDGAPDAAKLLADAPTTPPRHWWTAMPHDSDPEVRASDTVSVRAASTVAYHAW